MMASSAPSAEESPTPSGPAYAPSSSSSNSPCAACKFLRRKCQPDCIFAPYFPPDQPQKFAHVHKVFGASNVTKILNELNPYHREDAVNSLAYEADMRLRDPVYGCVGVISLLQHQLRQLQLDLARAKSELSKYQAAAAAATNIGLSTGVGSGLVHANHPIGIEFFRPSPAASDQLMMTTHEAEMAAAAAAAAAATATAARVGMHGMYDAGIVAAVNNMPAAVNVAPFGFQLSTPRTAGVDEKQAIGPS